MYKLLNMASEADKIIPDIKARVHKVTISAVTVALDIAIKNPTNFKLHVVRPYLTIAYKNSPIVSSDVSGDIIHINPFSESKRFTILVPISFLSVVTGPGAELLKKIQELINKPKDKEKTTMAFQVVVISKILRDSGEAVGDHVSQLSERQTSKMMNYGKTIDVSI